MVATTPSGVRYKGYILASELHARWAVFFDALDTQWEYKQHVFNLPYGGKCEPDFWLPFQQYWLTINADLPTEEELIRAADLSFATRNWSLVVWGHVGEHNIYAFNLPFYEQGYDKRYIFAVDEVSQQVMILNPLRSDDAYQFIGYSPGAQQMVMQRTDDILANPRLNAAYATARSARFD